MSKLNHAVRALLALGLLASSSAVLAQSAVYSGGTTVVVPLQTTSPVALGPNGQIIVSSLVTGTPNQGSYPQGGGGAFSAAIPEQVVTNNWITGPNGVGQTVFGSTFTYNAGGNYGASNGYDVDPYTGTFTPVAIGATGIASNINNLYSDLDEGSGGQGITGAVYSTVTGLVTYTGNGTQVAAINASDAVTGTLYSNASGSGLGGFYSQNSTTVAYSQYASAVGPSLPTGVQQAPIYESAGATSEIGGKLASGQGGRSQVLTPTVISTLGYGGNGVALNATGQVVGNDFMAAQTCIGGYGAQCQNGYFTTPNTEAFVTAANGGAVTYLGATIGTTVGVSSTATSVDNAGAVGGYITLADGQTQAFISDPGSSNALVAVDTPDDTGGYDYTQTLFLNNAGQAVIWDQSTNTYWLDNGGTDYLVSSLFASSAIPSGDYINGVAGLNDAGEILINVVNAAGVDPAVLGIQSGAFDPTQGTNLELTAQYVNYQAEGGVAPSTPYFMTPPPPPTCPSGDTGTYPDCTAPVTPPSSDVPEPTSVGLMGLGLLAIGAGVFGRKRKLATEA